jgi:hypothetical protein
MVLANKSKLVGKQLVKRMVSLQRKHLDAGSNARLEMRQSLQLAFRLIPKLFPKRPSLGKLFSSVVVPTTGRFGIEHFVDSVADYYLHKADGRKMLAVDLIRKDKKEANVNFVRFIGSEDFFRKEFAKIADTKGYVGRQKEHYVDQSWRTIYRIVQVAEGTLDEAETKLSLSI